MSFPAIRHIKLRPCASSQDSKNITSNIGIWKRKSNNARIEISCTAEELAPGASTKGSNGNDRAKGSLRCLPRWVPFCKRLKWRGTYGECLKIPLPEKSMQSRRETRNSITTVPLPTVPQSSLTALCCVKSMPRVKI